jgi:predicted amidophosphoribosyltransferase
MPLAKCARCEKLFAKVTNDICPSCVPLEELDHEKIRGCLSDHPDLSAEGLSEMTGVSLACIMRMIDQGLVTNSLFTGTVKCGKCGAPAISPSKRLCHACLEEMNQRVAKHRGQIEQQQRKQVRIGEFATVRRSIDEKRRH